MEAATHEHVTFFLTGSRPGAHLDAIEGLGLRPALLAGYRDLTSLRYDFPLVLVTNRPDGPLVQSLSGLMDDALAATAQGADGDRIRQHGMRIERAIRTLTSSGASGPLSSIWDGEARWLERDAEPSFADSLKKIRGAITVDGELVDCDATLPGRVVRHLWEAVQRQKVCVFHDRLDRLVMKLSDILGADFERSTARRDPSHLKASIGPGFSDAFDFAAMSRVLPGAGPGAGLPESRQKRIYQLLAVLTSRAFLPGCDGTANGNGGRPYTFAFDNCGDALAAFRRRMPSVVALAKAIAMAELEIDGLYRESRHDALFDEFGANGLDPQDLAAFPDYLVSVNAARLDAGELARLMDILGSGLPIKVLLQIDDILEESSDGPGALSAGMRTRQIASMAMGLNDVYVVQSTSANLLQYRDHLLRGLTYRGPSLFSVYSGAAAGWPPYLVAAAAMEARAFPAFVFDPSAGPDWASRFCLDANPQRGLDWPVHDFTYEDEQHQRVTERVAFTAVDFVASDPRYARHLARVPRDRWESDLVPVKDALSRQREGLPETVPSVLMVDPQNGLHKLIVDERLMREGRRCREMWHSLQELAGINNSHAEALLTRVRAACGACSPQGARPPAASAEPVIAVETLIASVPAELEPAQSLDDAYIETARCSTCNECTTINSKMFAYNANKQAFIADVTAGTYAQLVEAAESCQVSVIHPGKPRDPNEPGLEELLRRAAAFR